jgi:hypothetical protein
MNIKIPKMQAYCRLDGGIYDVNELHLNETPQLVVLNRIEAFEATYFPISGKDCEVFLMKEYEYDDDDYRDKFTEINGKPLFHYDLIACRRHGKINIMAVMDSICSIEDLIRSVYQTNVFTTDSLFKKILSCFYNHDDDEYNCNGFSENLREIFIEMYKNEEHYAEILKGKHAYTCVKIGNLFEYLNKEIINQLFENIRK